MQFDHLRSLIASGKEARTTKAGAPLQVPPPRSAPYIRPTFEKELFECEKPAVVLVSAVGATGKSAFAQVIANAGQMPLLDLSKHKAVGDNTISGLLTNSFPPSELEAVFSGLANGTFGMVIDGLDEGRSKTTQQGFDAFLDDIISLAKGAPRPSFVLLGRTDIVENAWMYLAGKGVEVGILSISPFDRTQANQYIDEVTGLGDSSQIQQYAQARDAILDCLSGAFSVPADKHEQGSFLSFIGYPPVLDAVATVLTQERNFHRLQSEVVAQGNADREIELLTAISAFILAREQNEKVWPNFLSDLCSNVDSALASRIRAEGFGEEQQSARLLAHCLERRIAFPVFGDTVLDSQLDEHLLTFLPEHPFLAGRKFRNAVFEAYALAVCFFSGKPDLERLAMDYIDAFRTTYHLAYMTAHVSQGRIFPLEHIRALIRASHDFRSPSSYVEVEIDGISSFSSENLVLMGVRVSLSVRVSGGEGGVSSDRLRGFEIEAKSSSNQPINLGDTLANALIFLPSEVTLRSASDLKLIAPVALFCDKLNLSAPAMTITSSHGQTDQFASLNAVSIKSELVTITDMGSNLKLILEQDTGIGYPLVKYVDKLDLSSFDPYFKPKYLKLRKLLTQFRSHSKGQLAKFADKVENERVAGNDSGGAILEKLLSDGVLTLEGKFYFIEPEQLHNHLGINWTDLRNGKVSEKLAAYLKDIPYA